MDKKWHKVTPEHFNVLFDCFDYTHSTDTGYTDFYRIELSNGELLDGMIKENIETHINEYFIKYF